LNAWKLVMTILAAAGLPPLRGHHFDSEPRRQELRRRGIVPRVARRKTPHGSGLGVFRWVAERALSWPHGVRKLRLVTEKDLDVQYAFLTLAVTIICYRYLASPFC
jgi:hypothetical protein